VKYKIRYLGVRMCRMPKLWIWDIFHFNGLFLAYLSVYYSLFLPQFLPPRGAVRLQGRRHSGHSCHDNTVKLWWPSGWLKPPFTPPSGAEAGICVHLFLRTSDSQLFRHRTDTHPPHHRHTYISLPPLPLPHTYKLILKHWRDYVVLITIFVSCMEPAVARSV
jgi:hypothetical protein